MANKEQLAILKQIDTLVYGRTEDEIKVVGGINYSPRITIDESALFVSAYLYRTLI